MKEAAVGMTGRCLAATLRSSRESKTTRAGRDFKDTVFAAAAAAAATAAAGQKKAGAAVAGEAAAPGSKTSSRVKQRWRAALPPSGAKELKALRCACDLAYRAYAGCGGVSAAVEALAQTALAEIDGYGDDIWEAADALPSIS